jgi:hypothetical protein
MTRKEFTSTSVALHRSAVAWQTPITTRLAADSRTMHRWASGEIKLADRAQKRPAEPTGGQETG